MPVGAGGAEGASEADAASRAVLRPTGAAASRSVGTRRRGGRSCAPRLAWVAVGALWLAWGVVAAPPAAAQPVGEGGSPPAAGPQVRYARAADALVLRYRRLIGGLRVEDPGPELRVYGDGRATLHFPAYMKRAGDYSRVLTRSELDGLLGGAVAAGLLDFDRGAAEARVLAGERERRRSGAEPPLFERSQEDASEFELHIDGVDGAEPGLRRGAAHRTLRVRALRQRARRFPELAEYARLDALRSALDELIERPGWRRDGGP